MRKIKDKKKQIAYFLATQNGVPRIIKREKFDLKKIDHLTYKKQFFPLNSKLPAFEIRNKQYFLFDITGTGQLLLKEIEEAYKMGEIKKDNKDPYLIPTGQLYLKTIFEDLSDAYTVLGQIAVNHTITDLLEASERKQNWRDIIIGAIMGGLGVGFTILILITQGVL